jgi:hypothetical protein
MVVCDEFSKGEAHHGFARMSRIKKQTIKEKPSDANAPNSFSADIAICPRRCLILFIVLSIRVTCVDPCSASFTAGGGG